MSESSVSIGPEFDLRDTVVLLTGAAGLIGREVTDAFLAYGAAVVITDVLSQDDMAIIAASYRASHPSAQIHPYRLDVTSEESVSSVFCAIDEQCGRVDVLVNLAALDAKFDGTTASSSEAISFEDYPLALWSRSVDVNSTGMIRVTQHAVRRMLKQGHGNIVNVASTYSLVAPNHALYLQPDGSRRLKPIDYVATKSMVPNFTRYLATLYADRGIRANCIVPHGIDNGHPDAFRANFERLSPIRRMCNRTELRGPFVFLASRASSYMTGATLVVDGGWTAW